MRKIILLLLVFFLLSGVVRSQTTGASNTDSLIIALQLKLDEWHKAGNFPGATLGVALENGKSFGIAVGVSDRNLKTWMKPNDLMLAGSVGKTFAAATALQLVKEGKIGLDDRIEKYLGRESWFSRLPNAKEAKMIYEGKAFSSDLLPQVLDGVAAPMLGRETKYGLGVIIRKTSLGTAYGHSGFFPGYMTDMMYFPDQKIAVAVQVNTSVPRNLGKPLSRVLVEMMEVIKARPGSDRASDLQFGAQTENFTRQETLRGSVTPEREWWDVLHYHLKVEFLPETRRLRGSNTVTFKTQKPGNKMQIDLQPPLAITKITHGDSQLKFEREGNVYWVMFGKDIPTGAEEKIEIFYEGVPVASKNPPWVGGITWGRDDLGEHFIVTTCQGIGASIWWPNKDHGSDEPDRGMQISVTVPEQLTAVSNGRLKKTDHDVAAKKKTFHWEVLNPINNYGVNVNIGNYVTFSEKYQGKSGVLDVDYWVLPHQKDSAIRQFKEVARTMEAFEHWFGKYPFYEDSFKLVTVSYPGMEHQSSVTYGNWFRNGYLQRDPCGCGVGLKFDFIIVHESAHEWFGNNISMKDAADMWIHEGFANYSENLFVEYHFGKKDAEDYVVGTRRGIANDRPIIGRYGTNKQGSGDMYPKGGNMLHTIRHIINDDAKWLSILRGLNVDFWHQTVTTEQIESYLSGKAGIDLSKVFDQYLRTTNIPLLRYRVNGKTLSFNYERVVKGFAMPIRVTINGKEIKITPNEEKQTFEFDEEIKTFEVNRNFYIEAGKSEL